MLGWRDSSASASLGSYPIWVRLENQGRLFCITWAALFEHAFPVATGHVYFFYPEGIQHFRCFFFVPERVPFGLFSYPVRIPCSHTLFAYPAAPGGLGQPLRTPLRLLFLCSPPYSYVVFCISSYFFVFLRIPLYSLVFLRIPTYSCLFLRISLFFFVFIGVPSYSPVFRRIPLYSFAFFYSFVFLCIPSYSWTLLRIPSYSIVLFRIPSYCHVRIALGCAFAYHSLQLQSQPSS